MKTTAAGSHSPFFVLSFLLVLTLLALPARAQVGEYRNELAVGGGVGYVMSQVGFMPEVPQTQHTGLLGGVTFRYTSEKYFNSICAVTAELNFAQVGWKQEILTVSDEPVINPVTGIGEEYQRTLNYLQIPLMARMGWGRERKGFQAFVQVGPQFNIFISESTKKNYDFDNRNLYMRTSKIVAQETMPVERNMEYGITGGAGIEFSNPEFGHLLLEGRYYYGLGDIYGNSKRDYFGRSNLTNIVIKFTYLFDMIKTNNSKIK